MKCSSFSLPVKRFLCSLLFQSGMANHKIAQLSKGKTLILMYHRILPKATVNELIEPGMYVSVESFSRQLSYLTQYFDILPLAAIIAGLVPGASDKGSNKPQCAITFDDGWLDFLYHAFPVLKRFNAPATVFLPTNFIGTNRRFWTDALAELLLHEHKVQQYITSTDPDKLRSNIISHYLSQTDATGREERLDHVISCLKRHRVEDIYMDLDALQIVGESNFSPAIRTFLNWDEVRLLNNSELITFGSHTADHNILTTIHSDEIRRELNLSKQRLIEENVISPNGPIFFCYPNGNVNEELTAMVDDVGYTGAVTTRKGWNTWSTNRFLLNRIGLHNDISSTEAMFACHIAGFM